MEAGGFEKPRSLLVSGLAFRRGVLASVNLHNQMDRVTVEVEHVRAEGMLASELDAELTGTQMAP